MNQMVIAATEKQKIAARFGQAADTYHTQAQMQKDCAQDLLSFFKELQMPLPEGTILEVGCGTGFLTQALLHTFPERSFEITDLSAEMLHFCQTHLDILPEQRDRLVFRQQDGEAIGLPTPPYAKPYAMIVSSFVAQWFTQPHQTLQTLFQTLSPGGVLLVSFPTCNSFPEWKTLCTQLNLPWTANPLPNPEQWVPMLAQTAAHHYSRIADIDLQFDHATAFLKSLKAIGAGSNQTGKQLSLRQMRQLIQAWDAQTWAQGQTDLRVQYQVFFGVFVR